MTKAAKPEGAAWITPYVMVPDVAKTIDFYTKTFGFSLKEKFDNQKGVVMHAELTYQGQSMMFGAEPTEGDEACSGMQVNAPVTSKINCPINLYVYCEDVDAMYKKAVEASCQSVFEPNDTFWGDRMCSFTCPNGYHWSFATHVGDFDPSKIPDNMK